MSYRREVESLLGKECIDTLLNHVRGGRMSEDQLKSFVCHIGELSDTDPEAPNVLFGKHMRRMNQVKDRQFDIELLEIFSDWWKTSLFQMTQEEATNVLDRALSQPEVNCQQLAKLLHPDNIQVTKCDHSEKQY